MTGVTPTSTVDPDEDEDEVRILDGRGCLTLEAMCFTDQLGPDQKAVVERHIRTCSVCAQQQTELARATERMRSARPRVPVPSEVKILTRQVALKGLAVRRTRQSQALKPRSTARIRVLGRIRPRWYRSRTFWAAAMMGMAAAVVLVLLVLVLLQR
jgi:hypothetical protein